MSGGSCARYSILSSVTAHLSHLLSREKQVTYLSYPEVLRNLILRIFECDSYFKIAILILRSHLIWGCDYEAVILILRYEAVILILRSQFLF